MWVPIDFICRERFLCEILWGWIKKLQTPNWSEQMGENPLRVYSSLFILRMWTIVPWYAAAEQDLEPRRMVEGDTVTVHRPPLSMFEDAIRLQYVSDLDPHPSVQLISTLSWLSQFSQRLIGTLPFLNFWLSKSTFIFRWLASTCQILKYVCMSNFAIDSYGLIVCDGLDSLLQSMMIPILIHDITIPSAVHFLGMISFQCVMSPLVVASLIIVRTFQFPLFA